MIQLSFSSPAMANLPYSSSPQSLSSASNSENSPTTTTKPTHSSLSPKLQFTLEKTISTRKKPEVATKFHDLYLANRIEKFKRYEADYTRRLMAKYFSKKNLYGVTEATPWLALFLQMALYVIVFSPVQAFEDQNNSESVTINATLSSISNGKHLPKKNG